MKKAIILLSGGLDSATTLYFAKKLGFKLTALIFNYHQRHKKEIEAAKKIAELNNVVHYVVKINLAWTHSSLTDMKKHVPLNRNLATHEIPSTYVAARNIVFLSYAFSLAESIGAKKVFIGAHIQDYSGYPDCRPQFLKAFEQAVDIGMKQGDIKIEAPLINKSKKEIIKMGLKLGVPFQHTWSCYQGGKFPCQKCDSCHFRINAFNQLGITDPLLISKKSNTSF
ncbi:MAG: 7-cyano-7-deazaguanine synthase QueC [Candidatus Omnitrophota bacterium]|nr:7-cyano-7-deazaguanine synthase QueC [Candidatus Omnitrophota bacterium]